MARPEVVQPIPGVRKAVERARRRGLTIGLVPTMGALHDGHARLFDQARRECGFVVVSVFVNPIQFDRAEDLAAYPRDLAGDVERCAASGVDLVFAPAVSDMYPVPHRTFVDVTGVTDHLCGRFRPGHFRGVATVVLELLEIVRPDRAYFGEKDAQQLAVVRRMVTDLQVPVAVVGVPTVREPDGLALSSRNRLLNPRERQLALALPRALEAAAAQIAAGVRDVAAIRRAALETIPADPAVRLEYLEVVDPDEMQPLATVAGRVRVMGAMWVGATRLIDNVPAG